MAGVKFLGPIKNRDAAKPENRGWFRNLPIGQEPDYVVLFNDFIADGQYNTNDVTVTETDSGATQAIAADELGGALLITNTAADNDQVNIQWKQDNWKMSAGKRLWLECRFKVSDATQSDWFVGLATSDTDVLTSTTDSVGFRKADGAATPVAITEDNTAETTTTLASTSNDTYYKFGFYWDGISRVYFYRDRSLVATHTAGIEQTNKLGLTIALQNGEAVAKTMTIDYIYVAMER